ncbi:sparc-like isoform X1 [Acyrthosiphon pisum]|uniref:ACYPI001359 protein n=1 Tax=Acyrthosiphon pisum TaxID=7029 RepID=C4WS50_ACYPI|nr:Sparc-like precursor [Acyrthosiphon pisum]XP_029344736.1 sparc-like isoform X1 [Acyrthosiphon pisum]BAH70720.1 ACYPI001359 [Acyrthosiphon pisum]|eukprot:NP_001155422.1 Sparc-like precursor [Acyrthosiphon pisum]
MVQFKDLVIRTLVLFILFECSLSLEEKPRKTKKWMRNKIENLPKNLMENVLVKSLEGKKNTGDGPSQMNVLQLSEMTNQQSPCQKKHCGAGRVCKLTENGEAECVCISDCPVETEDRRRVCSNYNQTWGSDCEIHRMRCNCEEKSEKCSNPEFSHLHVEYYGACKQLSACSDSEMADFPRRMREWLFHIMQDLADREELSPHFKNKMNVAETNMTKLWSNAAVWKWCDLDGYPHDRAVSRHELFPIRAPLMYLEHCIAPFLNKCDDNSDHMVTLEEWGNCLEIPKETLEDECDDLRQELN